MLKSSILLLSLVALSACSSLRRSTNYEVTSTGNQYKSAQEIKDTEISKYELGLQNTSRPITENEYRQLQTRTYLKSLERNLQSSLQKNLYYKNKAFFRNDEERIEFLRIPDYADQLRWLENRRFFNRLSNYSEEVREAIEQNDVILYMPMNAVREAWGEPDLQEASGSDYRGNERWTYKTYQSTMDGYRPQNRVIFFENGRVIAWRTE